MRFKFFTPAVQENADIWAQDKTAATTQTSKHLLMGQYSIGDAIKLYLAKSRLKGSIQALQIEDVWEEIMGKTIARYTDNIKVINKTLFVTTSVAPLKQELLYQKEKIKLRVNEALGEKVIEDIVIQ